MTARADHCRAPMSSVKELYGRLDFGQQALGNRSDSVLHTYRTSALTTVPWAQRKPPAVSRRGLCQVVRPCLEVALSAQDQVDLVLVLELIHNSRLGNRRNLRGRNPARE